MEPFGASWSHLEPFGANWSHLAAFVAIWINLEPVSPERLVDFFCPKRLGDFF